MDARNDRPDPDLLLRRLAEQEPHPKGRGTLKVFLGYAAGVGKTYAMLEAAHSALQAGVDVVAGYVEPHMRPETQALLEGLEQLPTLEIPCRDVMLRELDLDVAIRRRPQLILVDEMAHTNARGCRHVKRYQDIQELLRHGIDVYTTVNVQHVESLNDVVESITGVAVRERVPDSALSSADHVELVDIEPEDLLERLRKGKIYREEQAQRALGNFFVRENLVALREIALRRTADMINRAVEKNKTLAHRSDYFTNEHVLLCLSSSPSNARVIRTAARMAEAFHGALTALFVETSSTVAMSAENRARLNTHIRLAEQLGAKIATVEGDDVPWHVAEFAKAGGVSKIVLGRSGSPGFWFFRKPNFIDQLTALAPNLDIYVIPNQMRQTPEKPRRSGLSLAVSPADAARSMGLLAASTLVGAAFHVLQLSEANIVMAYMLGVLCAAMVTTGFVCSVVYSLCSVLAFDYFFTEPRFSFHAYDPEYPVTLLIMLLASGFISTLVKGMKQQKTLAAQKAFRTALLLETSQKLQLARDTGEILGETAHQLMQLLGRTVIIYPSAGTGKAAPCAAPLPPLPPLPSDRSTDAAAGAHMPTGAAGGSMLGDPLVMECDTQPEQTRMYISPAERAVAEWVYQNNHQAGAGTNTLPGALCLCLCIRGSKGPLAVAAVAVDRTPLDAFEKSLLIAVLGQCGMALENEIIRDARTHVFLQARQEALRASLLRGISQDMRAARHAGHCQHGGQRRQTCPAPRAYRPSRPPLRRPGGGARG